MDPSNEIAHSFLPIMVVYKDGRVQRLQDDVTVPPSADLVTGVASKDVVIDPNTGLAARLYLPSPVAPTSLDPTKKKLPLLVYYHGGGFCIGSAFWPMYHNMLNSLAAKAGIAVASVEYRLAPENSISTIYDDCWSALRWVASHVSGGEGKEPWLSSERVDFSRMFLAGDSAGGNIVHNMLMRGAAMDGLPLAGAALLHPFFWGTERMPSEKDREDGPLLPPEGMDALWPYLSGMGNDDPQINPAAEGAPSLAGLPCRRVLVAVAEKDTLRDRGRAYCEALQESGWGGKVELWETHGEDHVFHLFMPGTENANTLQNRIVGFMLQE